MATLFKTAIEAVFDAAWLTSVNGGVTVVNGSNSAKGIVSYDVDVTMGRELNAPRTGTVKCKTDDIGTVDTDGVITVDGARVFVTRTSVDPAGALTAIEFSETQPVPEEML